MKPGIYTQLPEADYHAVDARGSTDIKDLYADTTEWKYRMDHPEEDKDTAAKLLGSAIHARVLEGEDAFHAGYYLALDKAEAIAKGALNTSEDLKVWLKQNGETVSGKKSELVERIHAADPEVLILDEIIEAHAKANDGKELLTQVQWDKVVAGAEWCQADTMIGKFMKNGTFNLGLSEVSVIADHDGVPVKARYDHLANHGIIDVKSFSPFLNKEPIYAIPYAIKKMGYDLQAGHYINMWHKAKALWDAGQVFGDYPEGYFEKVFARDQPTWIWLFIKTVGAPQPYVRGFSTESTALAYSKRNAEEAITFYRQKMKRLGPDVPWPPENKIIELGDEELLRY